MRERERACGACCVPVVSPLFFSECLSAGAVSCWLLAPPIHSVEQTVADPNRKKYTAAKIYVFILLQHLCAVPAKVNPTCASSSARTEPQTPDRGEKPVVV